MYILTTGVPVRTGLHINDVQWPRQVRGTFVLFSYLVKRHVQMLLHWLGGLTKEQQLRNIIHVNVQKLAFILTLEKI